MAVAFQAEQKAAAKAPRQECAWRGRATTVRRSDGRSKGGRVREDIREMGSGRRNDVLGPRLDRS